MPGENANELPLRLNELIVKSAKDAASGERLVVLDEVGGEACCRKGGLAVHFRKPASIVAKAFRLNKFDIKQRGIQNQHPISVSGNGERRKSLRYCLKWNEQKTNSDNTLPRRSIVLV